MNKFMKHQKLQFKPGSFRLNGLFRVVFLICCLLSAGLTQAQEKKITAEFKDTPLSNVLKQLEKLSTYKILFTYDDVQSYKVTVSLKDATITEALQKVLDGKPFVFSDVANGKYISVVYQPKKKSETTKEIKGKVVDSKGETVIGATVRVVNATIGTATDIDGNFTLRVPENVMTLEIGVVGMKTQLVSIKDKTEVRVVMEEDNTVLEDVVVTGIFKKAKESYTGAVSSINAEQLKMYKGQNVLQTLKNIDASLNFTVNNAVGSNPNAVPQINIRGNSSLPISVQEYNESASNAVNTPLIIRDGFEISLEQLMDYNDDEIESINILKDAAATAIYGAKAANGVVVVETKAPEAGQLRLNYTGNLNFTFADLSDYNLMNAEEKLEYELLCGAIYQSMGPDGYLGAVAQEVKYNNRLAEVRRGVDTYWLNEPLRFATTHKHNVFLEGGDESFRYGIGVSYGKTQGVMKGSDRDVVNGNVRLMYRKGQLSFTNSFNVDYTIAKRESVPFSKFARVNPYFRKTDENGDPVKILESYSYLDLSTFSMKTENVYGPYYDLCNNNFDHTKTFGFTNNFEMNWRPVEELQVRGKIGLNKSSELAQKFSSPFNAAYVGVETDKKGEYTESNKYIFGYDGDLSVTYGKLLAERHMVNAVAGFNFSTKENSKNGYKAIVVLLMMSFQIQSLLKIIIRITKYSKK